MKGHIVQRGPKRFIVVVDEGRDEKGRRRQRWHSGFTSKKDAQRGLNQILHALAQGSYVRPNDITVAEFLRDWLPGIKSQIRPGTWSLYRTTVQAHIIPKIGHKRLQALSVNDLDKLYSTLLERGSREGQPLSPKTVRNVHGVLRSALRKAAQNKLIAENVALLATPPRRQRREMKTWTAEQVGTFLERANDDRLSGAWLFATTTGARRGELLGLQWKDVDLENGRASIQRTLVLVDNRPTWSEPKTENGLRTVPLPQRTVSALRVHRKNQLEERLLMGEGYAEQDLVFAEADGTPIHPSRLDREFKRLTRQAGLPEIRFHDLRHSYATVALRAGVHPKVVSEILGHGSISMTLDTYSHAIPSMQEAAAQQVADLFGI